MELAQLRTQFQTLGDALCSNHHPITLWPTILVSLQSRDLISFSFPRQAEQQKHFCSASGSFFLLSLPSKTKSLVLSQIFGT